MKTKIAFHHKIGLLGGGQLARMMALEGHRLGLEVHVLSEHFTDPAGQAVAHHHPGNPNVLEDLEHFIKKVDVVGFESEFYDAKLLKELGDKHQTPIFPDPLLMASLQDRLPQKNLLWESKLPTAAFLNVESLNELHDALQIYKKGFVLKKRRGGYDGHGTYFVHRESELDKVKHLIAGEPSGFIAEELVDFKREMALMCARDQFGNFVSLSLVETHQTQARCDWVKGPITHRAHKKLLQSLQEFLHKINYIGVIGFELFDLGGQLLINEIAPRVHNSGHYSQLALSENQFSLHMKCIAGYQIHKPQLLAKGFAMANLLGKSDHKPTWSQDLNCDLHWYGKKENRPGRKMGHINVLGSSSQRALSLALKERKKFRL